MVQKCAPKKTSNSTFVLDKLGVPEMKELLKRLNPDLKGISKMTRMECCKELLKLRRKWNTKKPPPLRPKAPPEASPKRGMLEYDGKNSCYIDTTLFALLHWTNNPWVEKNLLNKSAHKRFENENMQGIARDIQGHVESIRENIEKAYDSPPSVKCSKLRSLFKKFDTEYKKRFGDNGDEVEWLRTQNEPHDVLDILNRVFGIESDVTRIRTVSSAVKETVMYNAPIIGVDDLTMVDPPVHLYDYIPLVEKEEVVEGVDGKEKTIVTKEEYVNANVLYINITRNYMDKKKLKTEVIPRKKIELRDRKEPLNLVSLLVHRGNQPTFGHYVCFYKDENDGRWYLYDDMSGYKLIGGWTDVLGYNRGDVKKNVVGLFYI